MKYYQDGGVTIPTYTATRPYLGDAPEFNYTEGPAALPLTNAAGITSLVSDPTFAQKQQFAAGMPGSYIGEDANQTVYLPRRPGSMGRSYFGNTVFTPSTGITTGGAGTDSTAGATDTTAGATDTTAGEDSDSLLRQQIEAMGLTQEQWTNLYNSAFGQGAAAGWGTDTTAGATDSTAGATDTTAGATDTTAGATDTTAGGTDTTAGGTDTTTTADATTAATAVQDFADTYLYTADEKVLDATDYIAMNTWLANNPTVVVADLAGALGVDTALLQAHLVANPITTQESAQGGMIGRAHGGLTSLNPQGRYFGGPADGMADSIPATIDGNEPAMLSDGEFVVPADVVSHLGNGNSDAGADQLFGMMDRVRQARTGTKSQGKEINPMQYTLA